MSHSHGFNVTRGYVKIDFTPAWTLNAKVIDSIFFSDQKSKQGKARDLEASVKIQDRSAIFSLRPFRYAARAEGEGQTGQGSSGNAKKIKGKPLPPQKDQLTLY